MRKRAGLPAVEARELETPSFALRPNLRGDESCGIVFPKLMAKLPDERGLAASREPGYENVLPR